MLKVIHKYQFEAGSNILEVDVPKHHGVLCAQMQDEVPTVWIEKEFEAEDVGKIIFELIPTGSIFHVNTEPPRMYIGTLQSGYLVYHVYGQWIKIQEGYNG